LIENISDAATSRFNKSIGIIEEIILETENI